MSGGHGNQGLLLHGHSPLHSLPAEWKLAAVGAFVLSVVTTPPEAVWAFGVYAGMLTGAAAWARLPPASVVRRLVMALPFLAFALLLPFVGSGDRVEVGALALSRDGLWAAWNIVAKASLGATAAIVLMSTTPMSDLLRGLERLKAPRTMTAIAGFMVRYADVITAEMRRMKIARESRGYAPRGLWHARALASGLGTLFIRSFERGERVYVAMASRGFDGSLPAAAPVRARPGERAGALGFACAAATVAILAWVLPG